MAAEEAEGWLVGQFTAQGHVPETGTLLDGFLQNQP